MKIDSLVKTTAIIVGLFVLVGVTHPALAQTAGTINFSATPTTGTNSVTPVATWSTSPTALFCRGSWQAASAANLGATGTSVSLPAMTSTADVTLTCSWSGGTGSKVVSWTPVLTNTNGTPLTDLAGFKIVYGTSSTALNSTKVVSSASATSDIVSGLSNGTWLFAVRQVNSAGIESDNSSPLASSVVAVANVTASKSITITVNTKPSPPGGIVVTDPVARNIQVDFQRWAFVSGVQVGTVALGTPCDASRKTADGLYVISDNTKITPRPASATYALVAKCG